MRKKVPQKPDQPTKPATKKNSFAEYLDKRWRLVVASDIKLAKVLESK